MERQSYQRMCLSKVYALKYCTSKAWILETILKTGCQQSCSLSPLAKLTQETYLRLFRVQTPGHILTKDAWFKILSQLQISYFFDFFQWGTTRGYNTREGSINFSLVRHAFQSCVHHWNAHDWRLCTAQTLGTYSGVQCIVQYHTISL